MRRGRGRHHRRPHGSDHQRHDRRQDGEDASTTASAEVSAIVEASKAVRDDVLVLCHGGPIAMPDDARYILDRVPGLDGFYGASSMERLPTELAITQQTRDFADLRLVKR